MGKELKQRKTESVHGKGSRKQVHLASPVGSLLGLTVFVLRLTPGWPDGVTESRWDSEAEKRPTLHQLAVVCSHHSEPRVTKHLPVDVPCWQTFLVSSPALPYIPTYLL